MLSTLFHQATPVRLAVGSVLILAATSYAADRSEAEVRSAVETWVRREAAEPRPDARIEIMEPYVVGDRVVAYIAHLGGGGFCLCGADDRLLPVYFYAPEGAYDADNEMCRILLDEIAGRAIALKSGDLSRRIVPGQAEALARRAARWADLIDGGDGDDGQSRASAPEMVILPLTSNWHQNAPYHDQCPTLGADHVKVGCGATAAAQVMYYWQWPPQGEDEQEHCYEFRWSWNWISVPLASDPGGLSGDPWTDRLRYNAGTRCLEMKGFWDDSLLKEAHKIHDSGICNEPYTVGCEFDPYNAFHLALVDLWDELDEYSDCEEIDFSRQTYNWALMRDQFVDPDDPNETPGRREVAKLCYHLGVAIEMDWGVDESSTLIGDVSGAMQDFFRYDNDESWGLWFDSDVTEELRFGRPVIASGLSPAHICVVHGFCTGGEEVQYLMNLGWGDKPGDSVRNGWHLIDDVFKGWPEGQITGIAPRDVVRFVGNGQFAGDGTPDAPYNSLVTAEQNAPAGTQLILRANTTFSVGSTGVTLTHPALLDLPGVVIQR